MNHSLKPWNTFGIDRMAKAIVRAENEQQLLSAWQQATAEDQPVLILGEGSNVLFLKDYAGTVIITALWELRSRKRLMPGIYTLGPEKTGINWCSLRWIMTCRVWKTLH